MSRPRRALVPAILAGLLCAIAVRAQAPAPSGKDSSMLLHATGTFDVKVTPVSSDNATLMGRMSIAKTFHGDLEGTSTGEMLTGGTAVKDSAVYVAIERVTGTLQGRTGTFLLHHTGVMTRGKPQLSVTVVPDSGTGQLAEISGTLDIIVEGGKHSYDFQYRLDKKP